MAFALAFAACSGSGDDAATSTTAEANATTTSTTQGVVEVNGGWVRRDITVASDVLAAGDAVVVVDVSRSVLNVVAFDARNGTELWRRRSTASGQFGGSGVGGPAFAGKTVILLEPGSDQDFIVGREPLSGKERWRVAVTDSFEPVVCGLLICTAERSLSGDEGVVARDPDTGVERWRSEGDSDAVLSNGEHRVDLLLGEDPALRAVDPATGQSRWTLRLAPTFGFPANSAGGWSFDQFGTDVIGYVGASDSETGPATRGGLVAVDLATGRSRWVRPDISTCFLPVKTLLLLCADESVERADPATGTTSWKLDRGFFPEEPDENDETVTVAGYSADERQLYLSDGPDKWIAVDTATGSSGAPAPGAVAWMLRLGSLEVRDGQADSYLHSTVPVPVDPATGEVIDNPVVAASEVPAGVGVTAGGMRFYLDGAHRIHAVPA